MTDERELLVEFVDWFISRPSGSGETPYHEDVDAFLVARQPQGEPCSLCHGDPERRPHCQCSTPRASQRFWRVFHMSWYHPFSDGWAAWSTSDGWSWTMLSNGNCPTRKVAEQNGIDSGLPPWKP
jgi:hypothetical protein